MRAAGTLPVAAFLALVLGCSSASDDEGVRDTTSAQTTRDAGGDAGGDAGDTTLQDAAGAVRGDGGKVDEKTAKEELKRRKIAMVTITVKLKTSISEQVLGKKIDGTAEAEARILGPVTVTIEASGELHIGERLVIVLDDSKVIVAGDPKTVKAAVDALKAACLNQVKPKSFGIVPATVVECCGVVDSAGMEE